MADIAGNERPGGMPGIQGFPAARGLFPLIAAVFAAASGAEGGSVRVEVLMDAAMLSDSRVGDRFIDAVDVSSTRHVLLAAGGQFYALGLGGIVPLGKGSARGVVSYAFTANHVLLAVRGSELCVMDTAGGLNRLFSLPSEGMGIGAGQYVMYLYDRAGKGARHPVYALAKGGRYARLFDVPAPIRAVAEMDGRLIFTNRNYLFAYDQKSRKLEALAALQDTREIRSVAVDTSRRRVYFSDDRAVYAVRDSGSVVISSWTGGALRYFDGGLLVFDPAKKLLVRLLGIEDGLAPAVPPPVPAVTPSPAVAPEPEAVAPVPAAVPPAAPAPAIAPVPAVAPEPEAVAPVPAAVPPAAPAVGKDTAAAVAAVNNVSYVRPYQHLMKLYENRCRAIDSFARRWDRRIRDSLERERQLRERLAQDEKELYGRVNGSVTAFTKDIIALKGKVSAGREGCSRAGNAFVNDGRVLCAQLRTLAAETDLVINSRYGEAAAMVARPQPAPSSADTAFRVEFPGCGADTGGIARPIVSLSLLRVCIGNEAALVRDTMASWQEKAAAFMRQEAAVAKQAEPIQAALLEQLAAPKDFQKVNRQQIEELKKQCGAFNSERSRLSAQMAAENRKHAESLDRIRRTFRGAFSNRAATAAEYITRSYGAAPAAPPAPAAAAAPVTSSVAVVPVSYVKALERLPLFYDSLFMATADFILKWDGKIKDSLAREQRIIEALAQDEKALADRMNRDAEAFSNDIVTLKGKVSADWNDLGRIRENMARDGKTLCGLLKGLGEQADRAIAGAFDEVSSRLTKSRPVPSAGDTVSEKTVNPQKIDTDVARHLAPANVILACYGNQIVPVLDTIAAWNQKALAVILKDAELTKQREPLQQKLDRCLSMHRDIQKANKKLIDDLKQQCRELDNERKKLADAMADDSWKLWQSMDRLKEQFRAAVRDRFADAVENIARTYEDTF